MENRIGTVIMNRRKLLGYTQQKLAESLCISAQAVSKWENGITCPEIELLPALADVLETSTDALLGYTAAPVTHYEKRYDTEHYYWGLLPNRICFEIMQLKPPTKPFRVLDIGCGEGKDAVFLAKNGYHVTAFDVAESGLEKPFLSPAPDREPKEIENGNWKSGELFMYYHDWLFHRNTEEIFDCDSGGVPHQHCMDCLIAENKLSCVANL